MKNSLNRIVCIGIFIFSSILAHTQEINDNIPANSFDPVVTNIKVGLSGGVDIPLVSLEGVNLLNHGIGYKAGLTADYYYGNFGLGLDFDYYRTKVGTELPSQIYYGTLGTAVIETNSDLTRLSLGFGVNYRIINTERLDVGLGARVGVANIGGGDILVQSIDPTSTSNTDTHLISTGFESKLTPTGKIQLEASYYFAEHFGIRARIYYTRHFNSHLDHELNIGTTLNPGIFYGENQFDLASPNPYTITDEPPIIIGAQNQEEEYCVDIGSYGATIGLVYRFGKKKQSVEQQNVNETICKDCSCPNDGHKVVITVRDKASGKVIPSADIAVKDVQGRIVASGTTNAFGVVDLGELPHGYYTVEGNVYGIATTQTIINQEEFIPNGIIQKEVLYTDLRFILKGKVVNKSTRQAEPNVIVNLTNQATRYVVQDNSDGLGYFAFRLDKGSSYDVVGVKENRLSDVARASTIGLNRSTTLFVDLELGVENFECGKGRVLDIKYEFDKATLLPASMYDLDKLTRYMQAHNISKVELSSHTDSRGSNEYNQDLSQRRAQSAVNYIMSKGISKSRIIARGYGETQLTNQCADGVICSESEHRLNRRTEAKLLCN